MASYQVELSSIVSSLKPFQLHEVGLNKWNENTGIIIILGKHATFEALKYKEKTVIECLIREDKLKVLVHAACCISVWKAEILPHLLEAGSNFQTRWLVYAALYHEERSVDLLEMCLFFDGCEGLQDSAIDLVDYCVGAVTQIIELARNGYRMNESYFHFETIAQSIERKRCDTICGIGLVCIHILSMLAKNEAVLPSSLKHRMVIANDVPWLMADLLRFRPWNLYVSKEKSIEKFKYEKQTLLCLHYLILNKSIIELIRMDQSRWDKLSELGEFLHEINIDRSTDISDLAEYFCRLKNKSYHENLTSGVKTESVSEKVPQMKREILKIAAENGGFYKISQNQFHDLEESVSLMVERDNRLRSAYEMEKMMQMMSKMGKSTSTKLCAKCSKVAEKKCSKCKLTNYCSRECQLADWKQHKLTCSAQL